jgi:hypothetical protein
MPPLEQITIAPRLTFDALAAGKPGAPLGLHDAVAVVGAGGPDDRRFHRRLGRRHWLGARHASPLHGQLTNFLILFHYCDG